MNISATRAIGPLSVRYAAQIREFLFWQALRRVVAEQEAARAAAPKKDVQTDTSIAVEPAAESAATVATQSVLDDPPASTADDPDNLKGSLVDVHA